MPNRFATAERWQLLADPSEPFVHKAMKTSTVYLDSKQFFQTPIREMYFGPETAQQGELALLCWCFEYDTVHAEGVYESLGQVGIKHAFFVRSVGATATRR